MTFKPGQIPRGRWASVLLGGRPSHQDQRQVESAQCCLAAAQRPQRDMKLVCRRTIDGVPNRFRLAGWAATRNLPGQTVAEDGGAPSMRRPRLWC
jgi:hypothetical protein